MSRPHHLLMVCTANICRSPMAEGLARAYALERGRSVEVRSAGTMTERLGLAGRAADKKAVAVCAEVDIDISRHAATPVSEELVAWADYVLVMELRHAADLRERFPEHGDKLMLLAHHGGMGEIADPIGSWKFRFRATRKELARCVERFLDKLPQSAD